LQPSNPSGIVAGRPPLHLKNFSGETVFERYLTQTVFIVSKLDSGKPCDPVGKGNQIEGVKMVAGLFPGAVLSVFICVQAGLIESFG
jgi:hypothetical protein